MCGIAGWYRRGGRPVEARVLAAQCDAILHRGPDDGGVFTDGDFGFGMRRLAIIDIEGGRQPMQGEDGRFALVFNGEIYNHLDIRAELGAAARFRSHSDTETILRAWERWGPACLAKLEGMFAIAVWDRCERTVTLARDPLGIKPLYIAEQAGGLAFGSELKALFPIPELAFEIDPRAADDVFSFGHVRPPRSIYRGIGQLDPGSALTLGPAGEARRDVFWRPSFAPGLARSDVEWIEELRARWLATVERHMLSDVPLGVFLSGGVDSSAVAAAMARISGQPVRAFTIGFPSPRFDETPHAAAVARHLGCEHIVRVVDLKAAADILPRLAAAYDEPFADPAAVPTWYVSELAAEHVKVVLGGDGGDEIFAGYRRHRNERRMQRLGPWLRAAGRAAEHFEALPASPSRRLNHLRQRLQKFRQTALLPDGYARFFAKTQITTEARRERLYAPEFRAASGALGPEALRDAYFPDAGRPSDPLEQFMLADLALQLPAGVLTKVDRASMAHSLEVRTPFLSHAMVDFALSAPLGLKLRRGVGKHMLRKAVEPWLPAGVLDRPKQGFQMPLAEWFAGDFGRFVGDLWRDGDARHAGLLEPAAVEAVIDDHVQGRRDESRFLFALSMFALWWDNRRMTGTSGGSTNAAHVCV
jgi:asparagine synthase (glutamine-hydrolysing)